MHDALSVVKVLLELIQCNSILIHMNLICKLVLSLGSEQLVQCLLVIFVQEAIGFQTGPDTWIHRLSHMAARGILLLQKKFWTVLLGFFVVEDFLHGFLLINEDHVLSDDVLAENLPHCRSKVHDCNDVRKFKLDINTLQPNKHVFEVQHVWYVISDSQIGLENLWLLHFFIIIGLHILNEGSDICGL